ncbi:MAG: YkgJ family cysteine cluster protein [Gemmatimonadetes bacterium]|nr:YkgJ family cysteine cluster protein [Gemmatimonadota bacterium]
MGVALVRRPVVRSFAADSAREAAAHARAGGHSIYWFAPSRPLLVVPRVCASDPGDLGLWSMLDLRRFRYRDETEGPFAGLSLTIVPRARLHRVRLRIRRDATLQPPTQEMALDCVACGACCHGSHVTLDARDVARFVSAGRPELARWPHARRCDGELVLTSRRGRRCRHLEGTRCGIYPIRPEACREFPAGSENCIAARAERGISVVAEVAGPYASYARPRPSRPSPEA